MPSVEAAIEQLRAARDAAHNATTPTQGHGAVARCRAALARLAPPNSAYLEQVELVLAEDASPQWHADALGEIVEALRADYYLGALGSIIELAHADLFDNTLDQAAALLDEGYVGPAIVLAGGVLEEHLRKLNAKHDLPLDDEHGRRLPFDRLATALTRNQTITEARRKTLVGYYGQRSHAVHRPNETLDLRDCGRAIDGIRDMIATLPA